VHSRTADHTGRAGRLRPDAFFDDDDVAGRRRRRRRRRVAAARRRLGLGAGRRRSPPRHRVPSLRRQSTSKMIKLSTFYDTIRECEEKKGKNNIGSAFTHISCYKTLVDQLKKDSNHSLSHGKVKMF